MVHLMAVINISPDSFHAPSRAWEDGGANVAAAIARIREFAAAGASIIDLGAVSTRPGAPEVTLDEEWRRLSPVLEALAGSNLLQQLGLRVSIDTTRAEIIRRASILIDKLIVNDISSGEDDPEMLPTAAALGLTFVAMHKRGKPATMDSLTDYHDGVMAELIRYFGDFEARAARAGLSDWILDPGLGFAKTPRQCWEILSRLKELLVFDRPVLIGAADKRFTRSVPQWVPRELEPAPETDADGTDIANALAVRNGASILRVHRI